MADLLRPKKKAKTENLSSITIGYLASRKGSRKAKDMTRIKILLDSGCAATLVNGDLISKLKTTADTKTKWTTKAGNFKTNRKCKIVFTMPALFENREVNWNCYVDDNSSKDCMYDLIIGRDLMHELGIDICFSTAEIKWDNASIPMQPTDKLADMNIDELEYELLFAHDPETTDAERIQNIIEHKYCPADLKEISQECALLNNEEKEQLYQSLDKFIYLMEL